MFALIKAWMFKRENYKYIYDIMTDLLSTFLIVFVVF